MTLKLSQLNTPAIEVSDERLIADFENQVTELQDAGTVNGVPVSGSSGVTSVDATGGTETTTGSPITTTGTVRATALVNSQTGTTYTYLTGDRGKLVSHSNAAAIAGTLPQAGGTFPAGWFIHIENRGVGLLTITPTTSTVDGAATIKLQTNQGVTICSDGTNYFTFRGRMLDFSTTSRVFGRKTAGAGVVEECSLTEILDFVGSAAQGDILYRNATDWVRLGAGTSGQFLKTLGAAANPAWGDPSSFTGGRPSSSPGAVYMMDDFFGNNVNGPDIGELGWTGIVGSPSSIANEASHPGMIQMQTTTTAGFYLSKSASVAEFLPSLTFDATFIFKLQQSDAATLSRVGIGLNPASNPPADGIYIEKLAADTQWFGVTRAASSQTRTAALASTSTNWVKIRIRRIDASTVGFTLDSGSEVQATLTIPTNGVYPFYFLQSTNASTKGITVDFFDIVLTGMTR